MATCTFQRAAGLCGLITSLLAVVQVMHSHCCLSGWRCRQTSKHCLAHVKSEVART